MKKQYFKPSIEQLSAQTEEYCESSGSIVVEITPETGGTASGTPGYGSNSGSKTDNLDG